MNAAYNSDLPNLYSAFKYSRNSSGNIFLPIYGGLVKIMSYFKFNNCAIFKK